MKNLSYGYGNNGKYPYRYIKRGSRGIIDNVIVDPETGEEITFENQAVKNSLANLNKGFATSGVSQATRSKISKHCRVLALCAEKRKVRNSKGNYVDHLCTFITLTLPSEQRHDDQQITKEILGTFLDKCRKLGLLSNYVWRAEKQKNGNIHYHIVSDTFANFSLFRRLWYVAVRKLDYLSKYTEKFSAMSYPEYHAQKFNSGKTPAETAAAYARGVRCRWSEPAACHVDYLTDISTVSKYISKYVSKSDDKNPNCVSGRSWSASQSVKESVVNFCGNTEFSKDWYHVGTDLMKRKTIVTDFFSFCLFGFNSLIAWFSDTLEPAKKLLREFFTPCEYWRNSVGLQLCS